MISYKKETVFVTAPPTPRDDGTRMVLGDQRPCRVGRGDRIKRDAHASFNCPSGCGGRVDTEDARNFTWLADKKIRWHGVPCSNCDKTYTVEMEDSE